MNIRRNEDLNGSGYVAKVSQRNVDLLHALNERLKGNSDLLFADYRGLDTLQTQQLRTVLKTTNAVITVVKNRIALRALEHIGISGQECQKMLSGPTALVYSRDDSFAALKVLIDFKKKHQIPNMKGAIIDGAFYDDRQVVTIATLPSRQQLLSTVVCTIQSPIQKLVSLLHTLVSRPVIVLNQVAQKEK